MTDWNTTYHYDYRAFPIREMSESQLRAYRRELAKAALTGLCANPATAEGDVAIMAFDQADEMIKFERREEGQAEQ